MVKRKLYYKKTIVYDKFDLDRIELEYKSGGNDEGPHHYYYFNLILTSGKKEIIYKLGTNNDKLNREAFDALINIVNLYIEPHNLNLNNIFIIIRIIKLNKII